MDDLISREAAIKGIGVLIREYREKGEYATADGLILSRRYVVKTLPAVDTASVTHGRWVEDSDGLPVCSVCDEVAMQKLYCDTLHGTWRYDVRFVKTPYCPFCGARMDGERRESE